jgi:DNA-binding NarL/FixJ family response regulator
MTNAPTGAYSRRLLAAGVNACLSKETTDTELLSTVWLAASGKYVINPTTASHGQTRRVIEAQPLTPREEDVFTLLRLGRTNAAIAQELHISVETVRTHSTHVYRKLQVRTRRELHGIELTQHEPPL